MTTGDPDGGGPMGTTLQSEGASGSRRASPLLEREVELAELDRSLEAAAGSAGGLVLLTGPAGIGKSRLLDAVSARGAERGFTVLSARGSEVEHEFAFGVVRQLLEPALSHADSSSRAELTAGAARLAEPIFAELTGPPLPGGDPSFGLLHSLYWLCVNLAERNPLILVVDDAHWADDASMRFLGFLARRLDGIPVLVAVAVRLGEPGAPLVGFEDLASTVDPLEPRPLSPAGVAEVVRGRLGSTLGEKLCLACHEATAGNPFLLRELVEELAATGREPNEIDPGEVAGLGPRRVAAAVLARIGRLGKDAHALANAAAVLEDRAQLKHVAALTHLDTEEAGRIADALEAAGVLERGRPLRFVHPIVRTAVYEEIPLAERGLAHRRAARLLDAAGSGAGTVAAHLLSAEPQGDDWTVEQLSHAARAGLNRGAPATAVRYLRRALAEPPAPAARPSLLLELGSAAARNGESDALELLQDAHAAAPDPFARAMAAGELSRALLGTGRVEEAIAPLERSLQELEGDESGLAAQLESLLLVTGVTALGAHRLLADRLARRSAEADALPHELAGLLLPALSLERVIAGATASDCVALADRALADGRLTKEYADTPLPYVAIGTLCWSDRLEEAERAIGQATRAARDSGSVDGLLFALSMGSRIRYMQGRLSEAQADAEVAMRPARESPWNLSAPHTAATLGEVLIERGELEAAAVALEATDTPAAGGSGFDAVITHARVRLHLAEGDAKHALGELDTLKALGGVGGKLLLKLPWRLQEVRARLALGETVEARRVAEEDVRTARAFGAPGPLGVALRGLAMTTKSHEGTATILREAVTELEQSAATLDRAYALVELGAALRRGGRRTEARETLRCGLDLAHRCGAPPLSDLALEELRAAGARPRRPLLSGIDALTPSERRVAELAAGGMSNKEVAQSLFVTVRTVEMHLSNAYRKLEINSRGELADSLRD